MRSNHFRAALQHSLLTDKNPQLNPVVIARVGSNPALPTIVFYGHYDVVPANESSWNSDPFVMTGRDGYVYGRGVADNKARTESILFAI